MSYQQPDLKQEILRRLENFERVKKSKELQQIVLFNCANDPILWINDWCWTFDPRRKPSMIPIRLFPIQEKYIRWRRERRANKENGLTEKARDLGMSVMAVLDQTHAWRFEKGYKGTFISKTQKLVDKIGDPDSLMEKVRITLRYLPDFFLPKGFSWDQHDNFAKLINPENGSVITGAFGSEAGRGGRSTVVDVDEFAFIDQAQRLEAAISQNSDSCFFTSTPNGSGNRFYIKRFDGSTPVFTARWTDDPRKDQAWFEKQKATLDPVILAQEILIDYTASIEGVYIEGKWVETAIDFPVQPSEKESCVAALDVASTGKNFNVLGIRKGNKVFHVQSWKGLDTTQTAFKIIEIFEDLPEDKKWKSINVDADGIGEGVLATWAAIPDLPFEAVAIRGGSSPSEMEWEGEDKTSKEKFYNLRAENYGILRSRFKKTFDHVNKIKEYPLDELISIPNNSDLIAQLSQPLRKYTTSRKIIVESKEDLAKRGVNSPDHADMLSYLFSNGGNADVDTDWLAEC